MESQNIFYCWQSDRPHERNLIEEALRRAAKAVAADDAVEVEPVIDRDTRGLPGSPEIAQSIFEKIGSATAVVADVTIVGRTDHRPACNPNVLIEVGYAFGVLGAERVILVMNTFFGAPSELPFDLRSRRVLSFDFAPGTEKASARRQLVAQLEHAIRLLLESNAGKRTPPGLRKIEIAVNESMENVQRWLPFIGEMQQVGAMGPVPTPHLASALLHVAVVDSAQISESLYVQLAEAERNLTAVDEDIAQVATAGFLENWSAWRKASDVAARAELNLGEASRLIGILKGGA